MATEAQMQANRANAQLSSGPSSSEGKLKSSHNALKTGLTGRTILLPSDDVAAYENFVALISTKFQPADDYEKHLVQSIADTEWRLLRIPTLEAGYYALGRHELAAECAHESDPKVRAATLDALINRTYKKDFNNLALQERRLRTQLEKHIAQLQQLQEEREAIQFHRRNQAMYQISPAIKFNAPAPVADFGFEITDEFLRLRKDAFRQFGNDILLKFDHAWRANARKRAS